MCVYVCTHACACVCARLTASGTSPSEIHCDFIALTDSSGATAGPKLAADSAERPIAAGAEWKEVTDPVFCGVEPAELCPCMYIQHATILYTIYIFTYTHNTQYFKHFTFPMVVT